MKKFDEIATKDKGNILRYQDAINTNLKHKLKLKQRPEQEKSGEKIRKSKPKIIRLKAKKEASHKEHKLSMLSNVQDLLYPVQRQEALANNKRRLNRSSKNIMQQSYDDKKSRNLSAQLPLIRGTMKQRKKRKHLHFTNL